VPRTQPTYNQNQILTEQPKIQHQEEPTNHNVDIKESQEPIKKDIPITEGTIFYYKYKLNCMKSNFSLNRVKNLWMKL